VILQEAIALFVEQHPHYATAEGAAWQCDKASTDFLVLCGFHRVPELVNDYSFVVDGTSAYGPRPNPDPMFYKRQRHDTLTETDRYGTEQPVITSSWHMIVETPDFWIDFTAKQYYSEAEYPKFIMKHAAAAAGGM
jgi:hypothetical protein